MAVIGAHQMRLRSSAHSSHVLDGFHRHGGILALSSQRSAFSNQPLPYIDHNSFPMLLCPVFKTTL
jgi:hypothetical protein